MHLRKYPLRFICVFLTLIICLSFFSLKFVLIQVFHYSYLSQLAQKQHNHFIPLEPTRGTIYDRNLRPLALNVAVYSLYANPRIMKEKDKHKVLQQLPALLNVSEDFLKKRLNKRKYFVWLARKLPDERVDQIRSLKIQGLDFIKESKRIYPHQFLASHLIGFAGIDNKGLEGLELYYDKYLKGELGWTNMLRDAKQRDLMIEKSFLPPKHGFHVVLTIDETIQYIAEKALEESFKKHKAQAASIIVMDVNTGEVLAFANRPTYNLSEVGSSSKESRTNRAITYLYEPGSVFKIVTAAAALEQGTVKETDKFFCENGEYRIANNILHDHQPHGTLTFQEVIEKSSNIGTVKVAQRLGSNLIYEYAKRFHFGKKAGIDLPGEVSGMVKSPQFWSKTTMGAFPIGYEVTVTPLQLLCAISSIANGGVYMKPFVVKYIKDENGEIIMKNESQAIDRVISEETSQRLRSILGGVVENGTGRMARIEGVKVGGKTGTARKVINGAYTAKYYASFIGFAPLDNPRIAAIIVFDEPHPSYFGGTVAAPVFKEVFADTLKYIKVNGEPSTALAQGKISDP